MNFLNVYVDVLGTILSLVLFFVALGVLVTIHELGHFIAAKSFKVYCTDFSIGFGPKIVKIKRKKGETTYSIGVLPLGGYVSMLGEEGESDNLPEGVTVPNSRTLNGISRWKRVIIMAAGITMNFVLAYIIFVICASCFPQIQVNAYYDVNQEVAKNYFTDEGGQFSNNDQFQTTRFTLKSTSNGERVWKQYNEETDKNEVNVIRLLHKGYIESTVNPGKKYIATLSYSFSQGVNDTDITRNIYLYETNQDASNDEYNFPIFVNNQIVSYEFKDGDVFNLPVVYYNALNENEIVNNDENVTYEKSENNALKTYNGILKLVVNDGQFEQVGISFHKFTYWNGLNSFKVAGDLWVESTSLISSALGKLFVGQGWDQLGGPLAIFTQTTSILKNNPFYFYLQTWGVLSVNLALFNLLPFPGLDGWQILVEIVEGGVNLVRKGNYKLSKKNKRSDETSDANENNIIDLSDNEVTTNKNANLTIGEKSSKDEYHEWKIPAKVKGIMSYIGLGLLFLLMIFVIIKDIMGLF